MYLLSLIFQWNSSYFKNKTKQNSAMLLLTIIIIYRSHLLWILQKIEIICFVFVVSTRNEIVGDSIQVNESVVRIRTFFQKLKSEWGAVIRFSLFSLTKFTQGMDFNNVELYLIGEENIASRQVVFSPYSLEMIMVRIMAKKVIFLRNKRLSFRKIWIKSRIQSFRRKLWKIRTFWSCWKHL